MDNLFNVYVIWRLDGPITITLLQFEDSDMQRQAMQQWSLRDYVVQAYDVEFDCDEPNAIEAGASYEILGIFESNDLRWIF